MNDITSKISTIDIGRTDVLIMCFYLLYLLPFFLLVLYHIPYWYPALPISPKIETGKTWSIFNLLNRNWAGFSLEFHVQYDSAIWLYGSTRRQSLKRAFVFERIAWSSMIWIVLFIILLVLWSLYCSAGWIGMLTIPSATIPCNGVLLYWIFVLYCGIPHCQNSIWVFLLIIVKIKRFLVQILHTTEL